MIKEDIILIGKYGNTIEYQNLKKCDGYQPERIRSEKSYYSPDFEIQIDRKITSNRPYIVVKVNKRETAY